MPEFLNAAAPGLVLPRGERYWTSLEMFDYRYVRPTYTPREVSRMFFGRGARWFKAHVLDYGNDMIAGWDIPRDGRGGRRYKLHHVEVIANGLIARHVIDGRQFMWTIEMLKIQARMWGYHEQIEELERRAASERDV